MKLLGLFQYNFYVLQCSNSNTLRDTKILAICQKGNIIEENNVNFFEILAISQVDMSELRVATLLTHTQKDYSGV